MADSIVATVHEAVGEDETKGMWAWTILRILLGWSFLWAFLDKFFGLGFATCRASDSSDIDFFCDAAMIKGGSPTYGYLNFATQGSHTGGLFDWMAPSAPDSINFADVLFMAALLLGGVALMAGIATKTAAYGGAVLMAFMFFAGDVWPTNNPINSSHVIEFFVFMGIAYVGPGKFSAQSWADEKLPFLKKIP